MYFDDAFDLHLERGRGNVKSGNSFRELIIKAGVGEVYVLGGSSQHLSSLSCIVLLAHFYILSLSLPMRN